MIHGAIMVRNEQGRWLEKVLDQMKSICNDIVTLDDGSTDDTPEICKNYGEVWYSDRSYWGTDELRQRKFLWELATHGAREGDWILCLDADETFANPEVVKPYILQADKYDCNGLGFPLYDMWSLTHYRDDYLWNAHERMWVMCVRYEDKEYFWHNQPLHCGRFPMNAGCRIASSPVRIQHWGWSRPEDRRIKYERYLKADPQGKNGSLAQYLSIMDSEPHLVKFKL